VRQVAGWTWWVGGREEEGLDIWFDAPSGRGEGEDFEPLLVVLSQSGSWCGGL